MVLPFLEGVGRLRQPRCSVQFWFYVSGLHIEFGILGFEQGLHNLARFLIGRAHMRCETSSTTSPLQLLIEWNVSKYQF